MESLKINFQKIKYAIDLFKRAFGRYWFQVALTTFLGLISGLFGGVGIGILIPLFSVATKQVGTPDAITKLTKQLFASAHIHFTVPYLLLSMLMLFIGKAVITYLVGYANNMMATNYQQNTRKLLLRKSLNTNWLFIMNQKIGYIDRIILEDAPGSSGILLQLGDTIMRFTSMAMYAFIAFKISPVITLITFGVGGIIFLLMKRLFFRIRQLSMYMNNLGKEAAHYIIEAMLGIKTIKASASEHYIAQRGGEYFEDMKRSQRRSLYFELIPATFFEPISFVFIGIMFIFYYKQPGFNIASFAVIMYLVQKIFNLMQNVQVRISGINGALPLLDIVLKYQETADKNKEAEHGNESFEFKDKISFENVGFAYPGNEMILNDLSFTVSRGEMVGLIGPSGAGKTTIVDILLHLLDPQTGRIAIDGKNITSISRRSWAKHVGYVSQDIFLLNETITSNIKFYDQSLTDEDIIKAAKMANIYDFIESLPDKFQTIVGERGIRLSGGQRQRIALARVLVRKPDVLILDEATSSLDNESEALIQETIKGLKNKITVLMIAHRLSTVLIADKVIVLDHGAIKETGAPEDLMRNENSYFYRTYHIHKQS